MLLESRTDTVVVGVSGDIVHDTAERFQQVALARLAAGDRHLVLEFSGVEFWDSSAFRTLVTLAQTVGRNGGHLIVTGHPRLAQLIERAGLSDLIRTASNVDTGIAGAIDARSDVTGPHRR